MPHPVHRNKKFPPHLAVCTVGMRPEVSPIEEALVTDATVELVCTNMKLAVFYIAGVGEEELAAGLT